MERLRLLVINGSLSPSGAELLTIVETAQLDSTNRRLGDFQEKSYAEPDNFIGTANLLGSPL